jgi:protocatechuate 3,4-dioxygenase beta subunit
MVLICSLLLALSIGQTSTAPEATGRIAGRVTVEGTHTPLAGVQVMLFPAEPRMGMMRMGPPPRAITDQDGRYAFERVAPGSYRIQFEKTGYAATAQSQTGTTQVSAGQSVQVVDVQLQKGAVIAGKVLDAAGEPMPDVHVTAMRRFSNPGMPLRMVPAGGSGPGQQTNDLGEFRISGLPAGEFYVAAMPRHQPMFGGPGVATTTARAQPAPQSRTTTATTFYPGTSDQNAALPVAVAAGAEVGNITFAMQAVPSFRVSGIVVDQDGAPVGGAMVMLMGDPRTGMFGGPAGSTRTRDNGRFDIDDVVAGSYRVNGSIPVMLGGRGAGGAGGGAAGVAENGSFVSVNAVGGFTSATWSSSSGDGRGGSTDPAVEIVVGDADVKDVRVTVRRQAPQ